MKIENAKMSSDKIFWLILIPMLGTVVCVRMYLHLVGIQHFYLGGYLIHHLFTGVLIVIPAAFTLAFSPRGPWSSLVAPPLLGVGSGLVFDQIVYLVATKATNEDYLSQTSWAGSIAFVFLGILILVLARWISRK